MTWTNEKPWDGIGAEVEAKLSAREMRGKAKIDLQVSKNKRLKSIENEKVFRFFKAFAEAGDAKIGRRRRSSSSAVLPECPVTG